MSVLDTFPNEVILHIFSYLDIPDIQLLATLYPELEQLSNDKALHRTRILVVAPSRVEHALFSNGGSLRPTIIDLVRRGLMRGIGIERRWRNGGYVYSPSAVNQYETSQRLQKNYLRRKLAAYLHTRSASKTATTMKGLHSAGVLPDIEYSTPSISRTLLPVMRQLKWCIQRDTLAQRVRRFNPLGASGLFLGWVEGRGHGILVDGERVRLAICPGVKKFVAFYEGLGK